MYSVYNLDDYLDIKKPVRDPLQPQNPTYRVLISGPSGSGKTNALCNGLMTGFFPFERIYVFSKSIEQDKYKLLKKYTDNITKNYKKLLLDKLGSDNFKALPEKELRIITQVGYYSDDLHKLEDIFNCVLDKEGFFTPQLIKPKGRLTKKQVEEYETLLKSDRRIKVDKHDMEVCIDENKHNLIVVDDMLSEKNQNIIEKIFIRGRHKNISAMYLTQSSRDVHTIIRKQCDIFIYFRTNSIYELQSISINEGFDYSFEIFKKIFKEATVDNNFLYIDKTQRELALKYRRNFDELIIVEEEENSIKEKSIKKKT